MIKVVYFFSVLINESAALQLGPLGQALNNNSFRIIHENWGCFI